VRHFECGSFAVVSLSPTAGFVPPERLTTRTYELDLTAVDVYAFGVTLWSLFMGVYKGGATHVLFLCVPSLMFVAHARACAPGEKPYEGVDRRLLIEEFLQSSEAHETHRLRFPEGDATGVSAAAFPRVIMLKCTMYDPKERLAMVDSVPALMSLLDMVCERVCGMYL